MTSLELTKKIVQILDNKKAREIKAVGIRDLSILADYFIVATGTSTTQVRALGNEVEFQLKNQYDIVPGHTEGYTSNQWVLLDYGHVILHVFGEETREFYDLERLWKDGEQVDVAALLEPEESAE